MANGDKKTSPNRVSGEVTGTGSAITVHCGFRPRKVTLINKTGEAVLFWNDSFPAASGYKINGLASGTNANESAHTHAILLDTGASAAGSSHNHDFTGTVSSLNLASPAFSGTGLTAAGQVMTTTDNQTMTLNQCAGMWLLAATAATPPMLIVSNTAVTGAPAVLTVIGAAATDAGAYKIVGVLPVGSNAAESSHTHGPGTLADAASGAGSAHTHTFTGAAGDTAYVSSDGVTQLYNGFTIGADTDINVNAEVIYWEACK